MEYIGLIKNEDIVEFNIFGRPQKAKVLCVGDNSYDEHGGKKEGFYELSTVEVDYLNHFRTEVDLLDFKDDIIKNLKIYNDNFGFNITFDKLINMELIYVTISVCEKDYVDVPDICFSFRSVEDKDINIGIGFRHGKIFGVGPADWIFD